MRERKGERFMGFEDKEYRLVVLDQTEESLDEMIALWGEGADGLYSMSVRYRMIYDAMRNIKSMIEEVRADEED